MSQYRDMAQQIVDGLADNAKTIEDLRTQTAQAIGFLIDDLRRIDAEIAALKAKSS